MDNDKEYTDYLTNDMAMVAYLKMNGHEAMDLEYDGSVCRWRFRIIGNLLTLVDEFQKNEARVNPREYNKFFSAAKRELHRVRDGRG